MPPYSYMGKELCGFSVDNVHRPDCNEETTAKEEETTVTAPQPAVPQAPYQASPPTPTMLEKPAQDCVVVEVPDGCVWITNQMLIEQANRIHGPAGVLERANLRGSFTTRSYVQQFGLVGHGRNEFGNLWRLGMLARYQTYPYKHRFRGCRVWLGWFMLPLVPGQMQARKPPSNQEIMAPSWFPAFFAGDMADEELQMSCLNIVVIGSKPWWVHRRRAVNVMEITSCI